MAAVVVAVTAAASAEAVAFVVVAFAVVGSTIAASTIGSSSLVILGTRSFTIPIHTTDTIPIAIILAIILMVTDTAALPTAVFVAVAFMAVDDPYNQSVYQGSAGIHRPVGGTNSAPSGSWETIIIVRSMA